MYEFGILLNLTLSREGFIVKFIKRNSLGPPSGRLSFIRKWIQLGDPSQSKAMRVFIRKYNRQLQRLLYILPPENMDRGFQLNPSLPANLPCLGSQLSILTISDLQTRIARYRVKIQTSRYCQNYIQPDLCNVFKRLQFKVGKCAHYLQFTKVQVEMLTKNWLIFSENLTYSWNFTLLKFYIIPAQEFRVTNIKF